MCLLTIQRIVKRSPIETVDGAGKLVELASPEFLTALGLPASAHGRRTQKRLRWSTSGCCEKKARGWERAPSTASSGSGRRS